MKKRTSKLRLRFLYLFVPLPVMALTLFLCGGCVYWHVETVYSSHRDDPAVAQLKAMGGTVRRHSRLHPLSFVEVDLYHDGDTYGVTFEGGTISSLEVETITQLTEVKSVGFSGCTFTNTGDLSKLATLSKLDSLHLKWCGLKDEDLSHLVGLKTLRFLFLQNNHLTDDCVPFLLQLPELRAAYLHGNHLTQTGLANLKKALPRLDINIVDD